jgi:hypothetical protein
MIGRIEKIIIQSKKGVPGYNCVGQTVSSRSLEEETALIWERKTRF